LAAFHFWDDGAYGRGPRAGGVPTGWVRDTVIFVSPWSFAGGIGSTGSDPGEVMASRLLDVMFPPAWLVGVRHVTGPPGSIELRSCMASPS